MACASEPDGLAAGAGALPGARRRCEAGKRTHGPGPRACLALLAATALLALAAPAQAQTEIWSATLTPVDLGESGVIGCLNVIAFAACSSTAILSDDDFTHDSTDYTVTALFVQANGNFSFSVDTIITTETAALTLVVGSTSLVLADATTQGTLGRIWASSGVSLTVGTAINVKLTAPAQAQTEIWSATLTPVDLGESGVIGCLNVIAFGVCSSTAILSDDDFTHDSTDYTVTALFVQANGNFSFSVDTTITTDITTETAALTLVVGSTSLVLADATTQGTLGRIWASSGVSLTVGTAINVKLTAAASTNTAPTVANTIPNQTATAGTAFSYAFLANTFADTDPGDTLTYTATQSDDTALPSWLSFAAATRTFSGTPTAADVGTVSVKVTASDGHGGSVSDTFDIVVSAAAGVTVSKSALTVTEEDTTGNTYTVVLDTRPTANVTVTVAGHAGTDVTPSPTSLTFTTTTWGTAQTVTVTAGDDADTANDAVTLTHSAASTDTGYEGISIDGVAVTVTDNDTAPATGAPTITGTAQVGQTLTAVTTGIMDADGLTSPTYTYQWIRVDGTEADIASENSSTYILVDADLGTTLKVRVTFADDLGHTETLTSAATATVGAAATGPTVTDVAVTSTPASGTTYYLAGEVIEFTVTFSAPVTVTATPKFAFRLGAATRQAAYASGSDSVALVFARTVQAGEVDRNGISWNALALALDGGTITQTGATTAARLTHAAQASLEGHRVDAAPPMQVSASVQGLALVLVYDEPLDPASMPAPGAYTVTATVGATATHPAVSEVSIYGIWVTLTLDAAPAAGATVTLAYAPPASNPVQDEAGNDAPAFSGQKVNGAAGNTAPTGAPTITGTAQVGQTLTASTTGIADADGLTSPTYTYQWIRVNGTEADIAGENSSTYILVDADLGTTLKVRVTFADDLGHTETLTSAATATVGAAATAALGQVLGVGVAPGNAHLVVTWTAVDTATGYTVQWMSGSQGYTTGDRQAPVTSGSTTRYTIPSLTNGTEYTVQVIATRTGATDGPPSEEMTGTPRVPPPPPPPPVTDLAQVLGVGVAPGNAHLVVTWTAVDTATGYTVQWMSDGEGYNTGDRQATVTSGSPTRYTIPSLTNGTAYTVRVIATRTGADDGPPSAEMTGTPRVPNTAATGAPTITGTAQVGETLTASTTGIADANGLTSPTYTYQWIRVDGTDEADIASANSSTYTLVDADLGTTLKVRVTFADDLGHTETLTSAATATVGAAATGPTVTDVAVTSTPASGTTYYLAGEVIEFTVTFSAPVTVTATPKFAFRLGAATRQAAYASGSDSVALVFARTVQAGEVDRNGISWNALALALDGGTITQTGATTAARLTHAAQASLEGHRVDAAPPMQVSASVQGLALVLVYDEPLDPASMPAPGAYTVTATVGATATHPAVSEVSIYGIWVTLTLDAAPAAGATVTLAYAPPASNPVQDEAGNDAPAFSGQKVNGAAGNTAPTGAPTITGTAQVGQTLTASTTGIADADGLTSPTYTYQWIRVNGTEADIAGENSSTYILVDADLGTTLKVRVTFADDLGHTETLTSAATATVGAAATAALGQVLGGGGRPGQRAPGGDLDGGGHRHGLHGAVDVGQPGLHHRRPAGPGHVGVDHALHDSQPHQRHGIHGAGDRDPDGRHRRPALGGDDGDAESAAAAATSTAAAGPCAGDRCGGHVNAGLGHHLLPGGRGHRIHRDVQRPGDGDRHTEVRVQAGRGDAAGRVRERLGQRGVGVRPDGAGRRGRSQRHLVECDRARPRRRDHHANGRDDGRAPDPRRAGAAGGAPGGRRPADAGLGVGAGAGAGAGLRRAARSGLDAGAGRVYGDGDGRSHRHEPGGVGGVDLRHLGDADTGREAGCGRDGDAGVRAAGVEPGAGRGGQRCAGVQRPVGEAGPAAAAAGDGPCAGAGGGGRPGQRAAGGDLDGGGHRHGLHGAVDVGQPGLQHRRPAGPGHVGVAHAPHDSQPHQRHGIHGASDRDPDGCRRRPAVGGDDGDAESAAAAAGDGPCAGAGGGGRPGQRAPGGDLDGGGHRHGLHGAVDVGQPGLHHRRPAGPGHVGVDHALHDSQPHQRHGIHGAGDRDPDGRHRRPALGGGDRDARHHARRAAGSAGGAGRRAGDADLGRPGE